MTGPAQPSEPVADERRKAKAFRDALATMIREHGLSIFSDEVIQQVEALLPEGTCTECYAVPEPHDGPGVPIRSLGRMHHGWCPTVPHLSPEQQADLQRRLKELDRARHFDPFHHTHPRLRGTDGNAPSGGGDRE